MSHKPLAVISFLLALPFTLFAESPNDYPADFINPRAELLLEWGLFIVALTLVVFVAVFIVYIQKEIFQKNARDLAKAVIDAQEDERRHLSFELHDTVAQNLASLSLNYDKDLLTETIHQIRSICYDLTPPSLQNDNLVDAISVFVSEFQEKTGIEAATIFDDNAMNDFLNSFPKGSQLYVFRIVQEALTNVEKHAGSPSSCSVIAKMTNGTPCIFITDNGDGFDIKKAQKKKDSHFGIMSMTERANFIGARVTIQSEIGSGTTVKVMFRK